MCATGKAFWGLRCIIRYMVTIQSHIFWSLHFCSSYTMTEPNQMKNNEKKERKTAIKNDMCVPSILARLCGVAGEWHLFYKYRHRGSRGRTQKSGQSTTLKNFIKDNREYIYKYRHQRNRDPSLSNLTVRTQTASLGWKHSQLSLSIVRARHNTPVSLLSHLALLRDHLAPFAVCGSMCSSDNSALYRQVKMGAAYIRVTAGTHGQLKSSLIKEYITYH